MPNGRLELKLLDVSGNFVDEKVDIFLRHQILSDDRRIRAANASGPFIIPGLNEAPQGLYRVEIDAPSYRMVSQFVNIKSSGVTQKTFTLPIDRNKVAKVKFPDFATLPAETQALLSRSKNVVGFLAKSGKELYDELDDVNLIAKAARTRLGNDRSVLSYIQTLTELRGDRFFAAIDPELHPETLHSVADEIFHVVDSSLHKPEPDFSIVDSYKTVDRYGNLQLTFSANKDHTVWQVDMDIDNAQGFEHLFQVVHNIGNSTHPYDIHEILIASQEIDPGYQLVLDT
jgi:hypothetical protein